jgi:beta-lactamase superfamily II metal-dependent hydrolase
VDALTVTQLDVGQGDEVLVEVPSGEGHAAARMLYDGGGEADTALAHLRDRRIRALDLVVASHPHHDHTGGLPRVLRRVDVDALLVGPDPLDDRAAPSTHETYDTARREGVPVLALAAGDRLRLGAAELIALSPPADGSAGTDLNEISLVLRLDHHDGRVLLTGPAPNAAP